LRLFRVSIDSRIVDWRRRDGLAVLRQRERIESPEPLHSRPPPG
jgi:hypothetical protein